MSKTRQNICNKDKCTVYKSNLSSQRKINIKSEENTSKRATNRLTTKRNERRDLNKFEPKRVASRSKSKEKVPKCSIEFGVNTLLTGPKLADSNCTTNIKQRVCKCGRRVMFKMVDNCTQYYVNNDSTVSSQCLNKCSIKTNTNVPCHKYNTHKKPQGRPVTVNNSGIKQPGASFVIYENPTPKTIYKPKYPIHLEVNRWAISRHPIRGPDF